MYKKATQAIFDTKTPFPLTKSIKRVMQEWLNNSRKTIIVDFEYNVQLLKTLKHEAIFQIAISNALGEWIVSGSTINHCMSRREHFENVKVWKHQFAMCYGSANEMPTEAITWYEIGHMIVSYTKVSKPRSLLFTTNKSLESWEYSDFPRLIGKS